MITFDDAAKRRIRFLTRRGLLELDIVLKRFMEKEFQHLSDAELSVFVEILDLPDQEFWLWSIRKKQQTILSLHCCWIKSGEAEL